MFWQLKGSPTSAINVDAVAEVSLNVQKGLVCFNGTRGQEWYSSHTSGAGASAEYREFLEMVNGTGEIKFMRPIPGLTIDPATGNVGIGGAKMTIDDPYRSGPPPESRLHVR